MESSQAPLNDMIDPKLELIVMIIKNTELDCCMWNDSVQRELATEILEALERRFDIAFQAR